VIAKVSRVGVSIVYFICQRLASRPQRCGGVLRN